MHLKEICTHLFIAALFTVGKIWKQPRSSTGKWIKKRIYIYIYVCVHIYIYIYTMYIIYTHTGRKMCICIHIHNIHIYREDTHTHTQKERYAYICVRAKSLPSHMTLCDSIDSSLPGSSILGIHQARILECIAILSFRASSQPRDQTHIYGIGRWVLYHWCHLRNPCTYIHINIYIYTHTYIERAYTNIHIYTHTQKEKYVCVCIYIYIHSNFQLHRRWVPWAPKLFKGQLCIHVSNHHIVHLKHVCYVNCISIKWGQEEVVAILESIVSSSIFLFTLCHNAHTHVCVCTYNRVHTHIHSQIHVHRLKQNKKQCYYQRIHWN